MLRRVRVAGPFPNFSAPMRSSDSLVSFGRHSGLPRARPTSMRALVLGRWRPRPACAPCVGEWSPGPRNTGLYRGETWVSQVTGLSSSRVLWSYTPPGATATRPVFVALAIAFEKNGTLGTRDVIDFVAAVPQPTRSRAYASPTPSPRSSQGSLPARAGSPLAGQVSHLLDNVRNFTKLSHPLLLSDQRRLVAPNFLL